jgi:predicted DNA-binding transcriptional regulator AlpA
MSRRRANPPIAPRILRTPQVAAYLGRSPTWFYEHREQLFAQGFPRAISALDGWDKEAVDHWISSLAKRAEAQAKGDAQSAWERAANG